MPSLPREAPPRIGPISDFFGAVVKPSDTSCTGLIQFPNHGFHEIETARYTVCNAGIACSEDLEDGIYHRCNLDTRILPAGSAVIIDTDGYADPGGYLFKIPVGLGGYYNLDFSLSGQCAAAGIQTVTWFVQLLKNGVVFFSDSITFQTVSGNVFPFFYRNFPIIALNAGDTLGAQTAAFGAGGTIFQVRGADTNQNTQTVLKYLGS